MVSIPISTTLNVDAVFTALENWIKQRPGLDFRNYGSLPPYRAELRSITKDRHRAQKALDEARALNPQRPELLADAFTRAFSGRLSWVVDEAPSVDFTCPCGLYVHSTRRKANQVHIEDCPYLGHLEYCTGQYWPTEYRKAAASVLETYIATWRQAEADAHPQTFTYRTIEDVKAANRQIGNHWFDRSTMRFFNTKLESGLIGGRYFITSERMDENHPRRFSVRMAKPDGTIDTVRDFGKFDDREDAREAIRDLMKAEGK